MVEFCIQTLMPKMVLDITVNICKPQGAMGYCCETDDNRTFEIEVDKSQKLRAMLETVAHEMVHVKQYAKNELHEYTMKKGHRYKGEFFSDKLDYWDEPWEIEAHGRETGLFVRWAEKHKLGKRKWTLDPGGAEARS